MESAPRRAASSSRLRYVRSLKGFEPIDIKRDSQSTIARERTRTVTSMRRFGSGFLLDLLPLRSRRWLPGMAFRFDIWPQGLASAFAQSLHADKSLPRGASLFLDGIHRHQFGLEGIAKLKYLLSSLIIKRALQNSSIASRTSSSSQL